MNQATLEMQDVTQTVRTWKRYPKYKDSGVEWLGEVPENWELKRIKYIAPISSKKVTKKPDDLTYIGLEHIESKTGRLLLDAPVESVESTVATFEKGNVLFGKLRPYLAKVILADFCGVCTTELLAFEPAKNIDGKFLCYQFLADGFIDLVNSFTYGTKMPRANGEQIINLSVAVPTFIEQKTIALFLDRETAKIDALIAKKERFIELLQEKRTALISHAVTKGLNPDVPMKDSGIEWLGEIPAHWDMVPSNRLFLESKERAHDDDEHLSATQKYGVIPLAEFERLEGRQVTHAVKNLDQRKHVEVGNFVISMRSFEGGIERVKARGCIRSSYVALVAEKKAHIGFYSYLFKSRAYIQGLQATATFIRDGQDLNYNNFRQVKLPCPGINEQKAIADFVERSIIRIDLLSDKIQLSIDHLKEYRTALISAAVTGKIDIREEVA
jgi:type I restriction enzyme S subunit